MTNFDVTGVSHVRLTITDIARSRDFYERVFGFAVAMEPPASVESDDDQQIADMLFGGVVYDAGDFLLGLRPVASTHDRFDPDRVGLDHLSLAVGGRADLETAAGLLDDVGAMREDIVDTGPGVGLVLLQFRDPDGNALELTAPHGS